MNKEFLVNLKTLSFNLQFNLTQNVELKLRMVTIKTTDNCSTYADYIR